MNPESLQALPIDPNLVVDLVQKRSWIPLSALAVGLIIRLLKDDSYLKNIPPRGRILAVFVAGQILGVIEALQAGKTYREAILWGVTQSVLAMVTHQIVIEGIRGGKELPVPFLTKKAVSSASSSAPSAEAAPSEPTQKPVDGGGTNGTS